MRQARLAFVGVLLAAAMAGAAVTVAYGLQTGFDRSAQQSDLPDVLVKTATEGRGEVDDVVKALPNVADRAYRFEVNGVGLTADGGFSEKGALSFVEDGRRGYAIVAGRDLSDRPGEVVVDRGVAREWRVKPGQTMTVGRLGAMTVVGIALSPDNVAFPLSTAPRVYVAQKPLLAEGERFPINQALIWANDPSNVDVMLQQARATSTQIRGVRFATQDGVRVLIDNAAGIVIALLVAFSLIALGAATTML
ncbi:MAG: ABC transporter permease, partial [Solirubrobacteraceae bacterium]